MIVTANEIWKYRTALMKISEIAAEEIQAYMVAHKFEIDDTFVEFAHAITTKYGDAAGALSCIFYDNVMEYDRLGREVDNRWEVYKGQDYVLPAMPAPTPSTDEVAKTIYGTAKTSLEEIPSAVSRLVKRTAEDTTLQNAYRDGNQAAWVPNGDTCAFCVALASRGWQNVTDEVMRGGHAEHIHANCDCTYVVRRNTRTIVAGYNPDRYYEQYADAEGNTPEQKINSMRRKYYAENRERILAQKADAYAKRQELNSSSAEETKIN